MVYYFERKSAADNFKLYNLHINGADRKQITDVKEFFPLIPSKFWSGFNTKLDTTPIIKQAEAFS